jgi:hypothetical protein
MRLVVPGLMLLAGCDVVFGLADPPPIAADAPVIDAPAIDAPPHPCTGVAVIHDEDLDGLDDTCDRCPSISDPIDPDRDGDGVGDGCDPNPDDPCEQRVKFDGFGVEPMDVVFTDTSWVHDPDAGDLHQMQANATSATAHFPGTLELTDIRFRASVTMLAFAGASLIGEFTLTQGLAALNGRSTRGYSCILKKDLTGGPQFRVQLSEEKQIGVPTLITSGDFTGEPLSTLEFELVNGADGALSCRVKGLTGNGFAMTTTAAPMPMGEIILFADNSSQRVHWIEVIQNTCPPR